MKIQDIVKLNPSEVLELALSDYDKSQANGLTYEGRPVVAFMDDWIVIRDHDCLACFAGICLIANNLPLEEVGKFTLGGFVRRQSPRVKRLMSFLNCCRTGDIFMALRAWEGEYPPLGYKDVIVASHRFYPDQWREDMNKVVAKLKELGR